MSGETEQSVSAWTVDSLLMHMMSLIAEKDEHLKELDRRYEQRFLAQERAVDAALHEREKAVQVALVGHETALTLALTTVRSFYDAILEERDRRYNQRAQGIEDTHEVALQNMIKEFGDRIDQVRSETVLAMAAAEKAISKAEAATERRFESVNEFRAQQADIITTFARKTEVDARLVGLTEKVDAANAQVIQMGASTLPRNEYDRAHTDLAERVIGVEKTLNEKIEAQVKTIDARISLLQSQISSIEAVTR